MTFGEMKQEVIDRGYNYIKTERIASFVQRSYQALCSRYPWPFLEATVTGVAPIEIADLKHVLSVTDVPAQTSLNGVDRQWLAQFYSNLEEPGTAAHWYLEGDTLKTFPVTSDQLTVRYLKRPADLADSDTPLVPEEWQYLIVDGAVVNCLKDDDEYDQARALKMDADNGTLEMVHDLLHRNYQNDRLVVRTGMPGDYL